MKMEVIVGKPFKAAFTKILETSMPMKVSRKVIKAAKEIEAHQNEYLDLRKSLIEKLAERDEEGKFIQFKKGDTAIK